MRSMVREGQRVGPTFQISGRLCRRATAGHERARAPRGGGRRPGTRTSSPRPPIWRRLQVPSSSTLEELHCAIQSAFGWENYHMWVFETSGAQYGIADRDLDIRNAAAE